MSSTVHFETPDLLSYTYNIYHSKLQPQLHGPRFSEYLVLHLFAGNTHCNEHTDNCLQHAIKAIYDRSKFPAPFNIKVIPLDIKGDNPCNLADLTTTLAIRDLIKGGRVKMIIATPPTSTFTNSHNHARTHNQPLCANGIQMRTATQLQNDNSCMYTVATLTISTIEHGGAALIFTPIPSGEHAVQPLHLLPYGLLHKLPIATHVRFKPLTHKGDYHGLSYVATGLRTHQHTICFHKRHKDLIHTQDPNHTTPPTHKSIKPIRQANHILNIASCTIETLLDFHRTSHAPITKYNDSDLTKALASIMPPRGTPHGHRSRHNNALPTASHNDTHHLSTTAPPCHT